MLGELFSILVFPGFLFLCVVGLLYEFFDRRLYARMQNRMGPPWFQPLADFIKLCAKEDIVPDGTPALPFKVVPLVALTAAVASFLYIPMWGTQALFSFTGDLVVVIYLLTLPTLCFFLGGWYSKSPYSTLGALRAVTQLFAYEVPLFLAVLAATQLAGTWSLSGLAEFYSRNPGWAISNIPGFIVALIALQGKLERLPFDIPEAETEIVGGAFTEYAGRPLAFFRMAVDVEMVVGCSLIAAVFLPFGLHQGPYVGFALYLVKTCFVLFLLATMRSIVARLRIEQMVDFCWKWLAPLAIAQLCLSLVLAGVVKL